MLYRGPQHYEVLNGLIRDNNILQEFEGVEIGVRYGETAVYLMRNNPDLFMYLVDPYAPYLDVGHQFTIEAQEAIKQHAIEKVKQAARDADGYMWIYKPSVEAAKLIQNDAVKKDFVFIDACHTYENVVNDIKAWSPLIRKGGLLTGHDYSMDGVKKAVQEFARKHKKEIFHSEPATDVWAIEI